ncbi:sigma-70 family RNA polymerase sigma factor [bacterium]|nr:sigma-70 family RNA polymerase sigma factor [bacterium]
MTDVINFEQVAEWLEEYQTISSEKKKEKLQNLIAITCLPLVKRIAHTLARRSTDPVEDIIQVGSLGLIKAIRLYNSKISRNFKSYATYLITGEIRHYLRDKASMIKAPRAIQELAYRVHKMTLEMIEELGERPTEAQIAKKMEMPVNKVQEAMDADRRKTTISLDQIIYQDDEEFSNWSDKIADLSYENVQSIWEDRMLLTESLENIEPELKDIVHMVYFKDMSQTEIANKMGISQMQVSRKLKKALGLLHDLIQEQQKV